MLLLPIADAPNFAARRPWATWSVITVNIVVFLAARMRHATPEAQELFLATWGYVPLAPRVETFFTSMFLHGSWLHLAGNMLFLWIFGDNVEGRLGPIGFLAAYLAGGLAAVLVFHGLEPHGTVPLVGASGAIFATQGIYFVAFPRNSVRFVFWFFFFTTFWVPARLVLGFFLAGDLVRLLLERGEPVAHGTVAYAAHVGGFAFGFLLAVVAGRLLPSAVPTSRRLGRDHEARLLLRHGLDALERGHVGSARGAFEVLLQQHPESPEAGTATLHLGWIALRFDGDRPRAALLFAHAAEHANDPAVRQLALQGLEAAS
ncbi:MAG: rhomboid family intramembrane serine protease [Planctomycetota bacterium]